MNKVKVLDCTLRDGGYCNEWKFGIDNMKHVIYSLVESNVDIIECGFLTNKCDYNENISKFTKVEQIKEILPDIKNESMFVALVNYGEYNINDLPVCDRTSITGIRVAFHKKDMMSALEFCKEIKKKGYKVFVQPMVSVSYTDEEFLSLIRYANQIEPYAFYIVDSFGMMKRKDMIRFFYMIEHNLQSNILIGFHSHNNLQLAYSNAQTLVETHTNRKLIIDSSIMGMGRGAGNLNTELFIEFLNDYQECCYDLKPILRVIDQVINTFYKKSLWGYSLPNYLSANYNTHPNYASYLDDKNTLTYENMNDIFSMMDMEKRLNFDKNYIEKLYLEYMSSGTVEDKHLLEFKNALLNKKVVIIAPGKSAEDDKKTIISFTNKPDVISISLNFSYPHVDTDYIFISNLRRYNKLEEDKKSKTIITSNIKGEGVYLSTEYSDLLNDIEAVKDNAGMMLIKFLINLGVDEIYLAGMDGYSHDITQNYVGENLQLITKQSLVDKINFGMEEMIKYYSKLVKINFLTKPRYISCI